MSGLWAKIKERSEELKEKRHISKFPESRGENNDKVLRQFLDKLKDPSVSDVLKRSASEK